MKFGINYGCLDFLSIRGQNKVFFFFQNKILYFIECVLLDNDMIFIKEKDNV